MARRCFSAEAALDWSGLAIPGLLFLIGLCVVACSEMGGCAIAPMPDGSGYSVGFRMSGNGTSSQEIAGFATGALSFLGIPAPVAAGVGGLLTVGLGLFGAGQQKKAAHLEGQQLGWDQREQAAAPAHPLPSPNAPAVAGTAPGVQT